MNRTSSFIFCCVVVVVVGCGFDCDMSPIEDDVWLGDDIDEDLDFEFLSGSSGELHRYVRGAEFTLYAETDRDVSDYTWTSSNPEYLEIMSYGDGYANCKAAGEGRSRITLEPSDVSTESSDIIPEENAIEVGVPAYAEVLVAGPTIAGDTHEEVHAQGMRMMTGGTAALLVKYYTAAGQPLYGNGVLEASSNSSHVALTVESVYAFESREWLLVNVQTSGSHEIELAVGGEPIEVYSSGEYLPSLTIHAVDHESVESVRLSPGDDDDASTADDGAWLIVRAVAVDGEENPIYGVLFEWTIGDQEAQGLDDIFRYQYNSASRETTLRASFNGLEPAEKRILASL